MRWKAKIAELEAEKHRLEFDLNVARRGIEKNRAEIQAELPAIIKKENGFAIAAVKELAINYRKSLRSELDEVRKIKDHLSRLKGMEITVGYLNGRIDAIEDAANKWDGFIGGLR